MANFKNTTYHVLNNAKDTFPSSSTKTGTMSVTIKQVVGVGTLFLSEVKIGDWIFDASQDELRQVTAIASNLLMTVDRAFSVNIPALTAVVITPKSNYVEIAAVIPPAQADGFLDGEAMFAGVPISFSKASRDSSAQKDFVDPLIFDATGTIILLEGIQ